MNSKKGKIFSFFLVLAILISNSIVNTSYAKSNFEDISFNSITINEYESLTKMYEELNNNIFRNSENDKLNKLSKEDINFINNYKEIYVKNIKALNELSDLQLQNLNYNDNQIDAIRNFDGTEKSMLRASATVDVVAKFTTFVRTENKTIANVRFEFEWNGRPIGFGDDIFAVAWSGPYKETSSRGRLTYKHNENNTYKYIDGYVKPEGVYGSSMSFKKYIKDWNPNDHHIESGYINVDLRSDTKVMDTIIYAEYGYNTLGVTPSVSIGGGGVSPSMTFSWSVKSIGRDRNYK